MGKRRSWFGFVKRLFIPESKSKEEKKSKTWRCVFGRLRMKQHHPAIEVVPERMLNDAKEEQRKYAFAVAVATAAAAEAAVAAATAAAEVVRLTGFPGELDMRHQHLAAIKIQSIYRAHLARKALRALKGVVRLQAVIRGQLVRRQIINQLRSLQSIAKIHPNVHQIRVPIFDNVCKNSDKQQFLSPRKESEKKEVKLECRSTKNWDYDFFPKQDKEIIWSQKLESDMKRERMKKYSFSHRERRSGQSLEEIITMKADRSHHFEQRAGVKASQLHETEKKNSTANPNSFDNEQIKATHEKFRNGDKQQSVEDSNSPSSLPRRSFCRLKRPDYSTGSDDTSLPNSPVFPSYMAATESAKAKARSISTPKQRLTILDIYSVNSSSPLKPKLTSWSSFNGELSSASNTSQYISLGTKRHSQDLKGHSFGS